MRTSILKSSVIATAAGSALVVAAFAASSVAPSTIGDSASKGDRLMVATKIAYPDSRVASAFDTFAETDREAGVTTLIRVPHAED